MNYYILRMLPVITDIPTLESFHNLLKNNPGLIIIKFGATWCGPCKTIEPYINTMFNNMPDNVQCVMIDIDKSLDFYSFMKKNRVLNGVPVIISYNKNNLSFVPDDFVVGANKEKLDAFSNRCLRTSNYAKGSGPLPVPKNVNMNMQFTNIIHNNIQNIPVQETVQQPIQQPQENQQDFNDTNFDDF